MASDPRYDTVRREGAHADWGGSDRWRMPTYQLRVCDARGRITVLVGCRFDRPTETIERAQRITT